MFVCNFYFVLQILFTQGCKKQNEELTTVQYNASIIVDQLPSVKASECLFKKSSKVSTSIEVFLNILNEFMR